MNSFMCFLVGIDWLCAFFLPIHSSKCFSCYCIGRYNTNILSWFGPFFFFFSFFFLFFFPFLLFHFADWTNPKWKSASWFWSKYLPQCVSVCLDIFSPFIQSFILHFPLLLFHDCDTDKLRHRVLNFIFYWVTDLLYITYVGILWRLKRILLY
jgi:hypothetical protein